MWSETIYYVKLKEEGVNSLNMMNKRFILLNIKNLSKLRCHSNEKKTEIAFSPTEYLNMECSLKILKILTDTWLVSNVEVERDEVFCFIELFIKLHLDGELLSSS